MAKLMDWVSRVLTREPVVRSLSLENPATPLSAPADWLFETLSGGFGLDGQLWVNERTAMQLSTVWACVRAISQDLATVPLNLYTRDAKGNKKLADNRVEFYLLQRRPNPHMTAAVFRQTMAMNKLLWGNAYAHIQYNGAGKIEALWPLYPQYVRMEITPSGTLRYICSSPTGKQDAVILGDDMIHLKDMSADGYSGLYVIRHLREAVGLGLALQNFGLYYFLNGSRPGGVLEMPGTLTPEAQERLRSSWQSVYTGPRNTNKVAILEQGMQFKPVAINNDNAQYIETRNMQALEICRIFRMPPHKVGILERATNNSIEQLGIEYGTDCLRPHCVETEQELNVKMFPSGGFEYEHDLDELTRGDFSSRQEGFAKGRTGGWFSVNDIRQKMNLNPIGKQGDIYLSPLNMIPAEKAEQIPVGKEATPTLKQPTPVDGKPVQGSPNGRSLTKDEIKGFTVGLFEDSVRRSLHYDRNAQLRKSVSQAFVKVLSLIAKMRGYTDDAEAIARSYADNLYLRREDWEKKSVAEVVDSEFDLAYSAMELKEQLQ